MSDRLESQLNSTITPLTSKRGMRNGIAIAIVAIISALLVIFAPKTEVITTTLTGEGCGKTEAQNVSCLLKSGEKELVLRECSTENPCDKSEYILGKKDKNMQYVLVKSQVFGESIQLITIDTESMTSSAGDTAFYTEVSDECKSKDSYEEKCFTFAVNEEQRKDIAEQNKKYNNLLKDYSK